MVGSVSEQNSVELYELGDQDQSLNIRGTLKYLKDQLPNPNVWMNSNRFLKFLCGSLMFHDRPSSLDPYGRKKLMSYKTIFFPMNKSTLVKNIFDECQEPGVDKGVIISKYLNRITPNEFGNLIKYFISKGQFFNLKDFFFNFFMKVRVRGNFDVRDVVEILYDANDDIIYAVGLITIAIWQIASHNGHYRKFTGGFIKRIAVDFADSMLLYPLIAEHVDALAKMFEVIILHYFGNQFPAISHFLGNEEEELNSSVPQQKTRLQEIVNMSKTNYGLLKIVASETVRLRKKLTLTDYFTKIKQEPDFKIPKRLRPFQAVCNHLKYGTITVNDVMQRIREVEGIILLDSLDADERMQINRECSRKRIIHNSNIFTWLCSLSPLGVGMVFRLMIKSTFNSHLLPRGLMRTLYLRRDLFMDWNQVINDLPDDNVLMFAMIIHTVWFVASLNDHYRKRSDGLSCIFEALFDYFYDNDELSMHTSINNFKKSVAHSLATIVDLSLKYDDPLAPVLDQHAKMQTVDGEQQVPVYDLTKISLTVRLRKLQSNQPIEVSDKLQLFQRLCDHIINGSYLDSEGNAVVIVEAKGVLRECASGNQFKPILTKINSGDYNHENFDSWKSELTWKLAGTLLKHLLREVFDHQLISDNVFNQLNDLSEEFLGDAELLKNIFNQLPQDNIDAIALVIYCMWIVSNRNELYKSNKTQALASVFLTLAGGMVHARNFTSPDMPSIFAQKLAKQVTAIADCDLGSEPQHEVVDIYCIEDKNDEKCASSDDGNEEGRDAEKYEPQDSQSSSTSSSSVADAEAAMGEAKISDEKVDGNQQLTPVTDTREHSGTPTGTREHSETPTGTRKGSETPTGTRKGSETPTGTRKHSEIVIETKMTITETLNELKMKNAIPVSDRLKLFYRVFQHLTSGTFTDDSSNKTRIIEAENILSSCQGSSEGRRCYGKILSRTFTLANFDEWISQLNPVAVGEIFIKLISHNFNGDVLPASAVCELDQLSDLTDAESIKSILNKLPQDNIHKLAMVIYVAWFVSNENKFHRNMIPPPVYSTITGSSRHWCNYKESASTEFLFKISKIMEAMANCDLAEPNQNESTSSGVKTEFCYTDDNFNEDRQQADQINQITPTATAEAAARDRDADESTKPKNSETDEKKPAKPKKKVQFVLPDPPSSNASYDDSTTTEYSDTDESLEIDSYSEVPTPNSLKSTIPKGSNMGKSPTPKRSSTSSESSLEDLSTSATAGVQDLSGLTPHVPLPNLHSTPVKSEAWQESPQRGKNRIKTDAPVMGASLLKNRVKTGAPVRALAQNPRATTAGNISQLGAGAGTTAAANAAAGTNIATISKTRQFRARRQTQVVPPLPNTQTPSSSESPGSSGIASAAASSSSRTPVTKSRKQSDSSGTSGVVSDSVGAANSRPANETGTSGASNVAAAISKAARPVSRLLRTRRQTQVVPPLPGNETSSSDTAGSSGGSSGASGSSSGHNGNK